MKQCSLCHEVRLGTLNRQKNRVVPFFFMLSGMVYNMVRFDASHIYNPNESHFFRQFVTNLGASRVITICAENQDEKGVCRLVLGCVHLSGAS